MADQLFHCLLDEQRALERVDILEDGPHDFGFVDVVDPHFSDLAERVMRTADRLVKQVLEALPQAVFGHYRASGRGVTLNSSLPTGRMVKANCSPSGSCTISRLTRLKMSDSTRPPSVM